jgi:predicted house-cleaning noncanonical NTP pyrophosphatase (MazG superfamily)
MVKEQMEKLINDLDKDNLRSLKPKLLRLLKLELLSFDDGNENISEQQLDDILNLVREKEEFDKDYLTDKEFLFIENFKCAYDEFVDDIVSKGYLRNAVELTIDVLKSIGGYTRGLKLFLENNDLSYIKSDQYLKNLKNELYNRIDQIIKDKSMQQLFLVLGLIHSISFILQKQIFEHSELLIEKIQNKQGTFKIECSDKHLDNFISKEYIEELQRRVYLWDKLTFELKHHYTLGKYKLKKQV